MFMERKQNLREENVCKDKVLKQDILIARCYIIVYLYSAQYLHILQDSKRFLTHILCVPRRICYPLGYMGR